MTLRLGAAAAGEIPARRIGLLPIAEATGQVNLVTDQYLSSNGAAGSCASPGGVER